MAALSNSRACSHPTLQPCHTVSQISQRNIISYSKTEALAKFSPKFFTGSRRLSLFLLPPSLSSEQKSFTGLAALRTGRASLERISPHRPNEKFMLRMLRAEEEPTKETEDKLVKASPDESGLWANRIQNIQTATHIFSAVMLWVGLFFIASIWDGENFISRGPSDRGPRK